MNKLSYISNKRIAGITLATVTAFGALGAGIITQAATATAGTISISSSGTLGVHLGYLAGSSHTLDVTPKAAGDLVVVAVVNDTWAVKVNSVSGGSVGTWAPAGAPFFDSADGEILQLWYGQATSTQTSALTVDWTGQVGNGDIVVQDFGTSAPATWSVTDQGSASSPFPALSAPDNASNLYFGAAMAWGNAAPGNTPGIDYSLPSNYVMLAWGAGVSGSVAPDGYGAGSVGAVFTATPSGSPAPLPSTTQTSAPSGGVALPVPTTTSAPNTTAAPATGAGNISDDGIILDKSGHIGASSYSATLAPRNQGDLLVMGVINDTWGVSVSSVTGGGVSTWQRAGQVWLDATDGQMMQFWYGTVSSTSPSPVQVRLTSGINNIQLMVDELSGGAGWSVGAPVSAARPFPVIGASSGSAYVGMGFAWGNAAAGNTTGVDYHVFSNAFMSAVAAPANGTVAPGGSGAGSLAVLVSATGSGGSTVAAPAPMPTTTQPPTTTVAPTPTTTAAPTGSSNGNLVPPASLMSKSVFDGNVQSWPVAADSSAMASDIVAQYEKAYGSVAVNQNRPVYWVPAGQAMVNVSVAPGCNNFTSNAGTSAPIPANALAGSSSDHILTVYQPSTGSAWEYWLAQKTSWGWQACWGGKLSLSSSNGVFPAPYGETATGISNVATEVTEADVQSGSINHAIAIEVLGDSCDSGYVWPADRGDCNGSGTHPKEGDWFRFPANLAMPSGLTPLGQMIFKAIQNYGAVVVDQGGAVAVEADSASAWTAEGHTGTDPITRAMNGQPEWKAVANLPWGSLQHVNPN